ncbi:g594 [Coccomyxa viridis]|uniref:thioredoxin-dependent peroxiredoxin n=1 Tax=Coccomyxa viridis TaxID=1274662 RepID=A0ABP1FMV5_9CHLO
MACRPRVAFRSSIQPFTPFRSLYGSAATLQRQQKLCRSAVRDRSSQLTRAELKVGSKMQDYPDYYRVLKSTEGASVALSNYEGKKPVVLFFYPRAATPGCTKQACAFRDAFGKFKDIGAEVFGISSDDVQKNSEFAKAQRLPFPLLTDQSEFLRKSFGIKGDLLGLLPGRQTFVIDKNGKIVLSFNDQFNPEKHVVEALDVVKTLV